MQPSGWLCLKPALCSSPTSLPLVVLSPLLLEDNHLGRLVVFYHCGRYSNHIFATIDGWYRHYHIHQQWCIYQCLVLLQSWCVCAHVHVHVCLIKKITDVYLRRGVPMRVAFSVPASRTCTKDSEMRWPCCITHTHAWAAPSSSVIQAIGYPR